MSQTGYTPIQLYRTTTSGAAPDAANLTAGELAININDADMALYAENQSGVVKRLMNNPAGLKYPTTDGTVNQVIVTNGSGVLSWAAGPSGTYLPLAGGTMTGAITFASGQTIANLASGSAGTIPYQTASGTTAMLAAGTLGQVLTSAGAAAPTWSTPAAATKTISNKTGAYTIVSGDLGAIINCTSGTFTVSLTAAASLGSGFTCTIWNTSNTATDAITIDPNASETIDGLATLVLRRGEGLAIVCNGTNWETDDKKPMRGYAENLYKGIVRPVASGDGSLAFGETASASGTYTIALGLSTTASATGAIAIGSGYASAVSAGSNYSLAIGTNSGANGSVTASGAGAMALGGSYASGADSFAAAIANNTSSYGAGAANGVAIGNIAKATTGVSIGNSSLASGGYANSLGVSTTASGSNSTAIGSNNIAAGQYSFAAGYQSQSNEIGKYSFSSGRFAATGDAQYGKIVLRGASTASVAILTSDGSGTASSTNQLALAANQAMVVKGMLIGKQVGGGNGIAAYEISASAVYVGGTLTLGAGVLTLIGSNTLPGTFTAPTITADTTNGAIKITSGKSSSTNVYWVCLLQSAEVTGS